MPRKLKLSPLQRDILMMLEEAGSEMMGTVIATIAQPDDPREFNRQVDEMVKLGLVRKERSADTVELVLTEQGKPALRA